MSILNISSDQSRPPSRIRPHQIVDTDTHAPRIHIDVGQSFRLRKRNASNDAVITVTPTDVFDFVLETSPWPARNGGRAGVYVALARIERGLAPLEACIATRGSSSSVAARWVNAAVTDTHYVLCLNWCVFKLGFGIDCNAWVGELVVMMSFMREQLILSCMVIWHLGQWREIHRSGLEERKKRSRLPLTKWEPLIEDAAHGNPRSAVVGQCMYIEQAPDDQPESMASRKKYYERWHSISWMPLVHGPYSTRQLDIRSQTSQLSLRAKFCRVQSDRY